LTGVRVLVVGSGAREHALCRSLAADPAVTDLICAPGNAGTTEVARAVPLDLDPAAIAALAADLRPDLVVIGPEGPLVAGAADAVRAVGIPVFGPSAAAAAIEGSKAFAKDVMAAAGVPTASALNCTDVGAALAHLRTVRPPYVVKYDGLAAGKGVTVTVSLPVAEAAVRHCLRKPSDRVLIEEYLDGPEVSLFALTDGTTVVPLLPAQDFKRVLDGDEGPNTGGMGAYAPLPWAPPDLVGGVGKTVLEPTVAELARRGTPFVGLLYAGLALTAAGPRVVEFNCRFGDPETQVVLALLETPLAGLLLAASTGRLAEVPPLTWRRGAAVTVVLAAAGYPAPPRTGDQVGGLVEAAAVSGVSVLHAGTRLVGGGVRSSGGRVLSVTATGSSLAAAREAAYDAVGRIRLDGAQYRSDIALAASRIEPAPGRWGGSAAREYR